MKKKIILFFIGIFTLFILIALQVFSRGEQNFQDSKVEYAGAETRITRAEIARMISLLTYTREELQALDRTITYSDTDESKWYDKFINAYEELGFTGEEEKESKEFHPMAYFTYGDCKVLFEQIREQTKNVELETKLYALLEQFMDGKEDDDNILPSQWIVLYQEIFDTGYDVELTEDSLYFVQSWENSETLGKWQTLTNKGVYYGDGLNFVQYLDGKHKVFVKNQEILYVGEEVEEETKISNIWILGKEEKTLRVFIEGCTKKFELVGAIKEDVSGQVGDLFIEKGKVTKVSIKPDRIKGRVLVTNDHYIEIENYGKKALTEDYCIYRTYGELSMDKNNSLVVGYENAEFVIVGDKICAAIITEPVVAENIRVLIKTTGFSDYYHSSIKLTSDTKYRISYGDEKKTYKGDKVLTITPDSEYFKKGRVFVTPVKEGESIVVKSIKRNGVNPSYEGTLEISKDENGLLLVNELSVENYLYAVVPSEMPTSYGEEALKVQAVCARSYAYKQLMANSLRRYGAHVDDSASYQVYNNVPGNKTAKKAVNATAGETIEYDGEIITAYYFSTSCGYTADASQVWNSTEELPYFSGELQLVKSSKKAEKKFEDLSKESDFKAFMKQDTYQTYDSETPWYRWKVSIAAETLEKNIEERLANRYEANPKLILTKQEDGSYKSVPIDTVGSIQKIQVGTRQTSGIITELIIKGSKNTIKVESEYNIRFLLAPWNSKIIRQDGSKIEGLSMLPSAFFYIEETTDGYRFVGGGYGHGVGMSQNGAKAMADLGFTYKEILKHYYLGADLAKH